MKRFWQVGTILSLLFALTMNGLALLGSLGPASINAVSDKYATLLTPASYAFSIWSLIYLLLIGFVAYQARDILRPRPGNDVPQKAGPLFVLANLCNGVWIYVFVHERIGASVLVLLLLTAALYGLLVRLRIALDDEPLPVIAGVWWPLLLYTGWVTVASVVNVASWLQARGIAVSALAACTVLVGLGLCLIGLLILRNVRELVLAATWGILAIGIGRLSVSVNEPVAGMAFGVAGVLLVAVAVHAYLNRQTNPILKLVRRRVRT